MAVKQKNLHWFCQQCNLPAVKAVKTDNEIEQKCKEYMIKLGSELRTELKGEVHDVQTSLEDKIEVEIDKMNKKIENIQMHSRSILNKDWECKKEEETERLLEEMRNREARKLNLIIFNLEESKADTGDERKSHDEEAIRKMLANIGAPVPFSRATHLGKREDPSIKRARPLRITTSNVADQHKILRTATQLKSLPPYHNIYINRDQTPLEQRHWRKLLEERRKKTEESKEIKEDVTWVIRRGNVIRGRAKKNINVEKEEAELTRRA